jgi:hypothetical protein
MNPLPQFKKTQILSPLMKNQRKTSKKDTNKDTKLADFEPKKDAKGGRKHHHHHQHQQSQTTVTGFGPGATGKWDI